MHQLEKKTRILHLINSLSFGGAEKLLYELALELKNSFNEPIDIALMYNKNNFRKELKFNGIKIVNLKVNPKFNPVAIYKLIRLVNREKYKIVHVHLFPAGFFMAAAARFIRKDIRLIFTEHSPCNRRRNTAFGKLLDKFTYARYLEIICVSTVVKKELTAWLPGLVRKISVIPNAIRIPKSVSQINKIYDVIFIGRLIEAKGIDILLRAIAYIKDQGIKKITTAIVGQGNLDKKLRAISHNLMIEDNVQFLGYRSDVTDLLCKSRIFVLPSRWEGIPIALLEAMGIGLPVIATRVGGIPEVIDHQINGLLIPPDNPRILADNIVRVLSNPDQMIRLGVTARQKIQKHYSIKSYAHKILSLYWGKSA